jgi:hypothetical protein
MNRMVKGIGLFCIVAGVTLSLSSSQLNRSLRRLGLNVELASLKELDLNSLRANVGGRGGSSPSNACVTAGQSCYPANSVPQAFSVCNFANSRPVTNCNLTPHMDCLRITSNSTLTCLFPLPFGSGGPPVFEACPGTVYTCTASGWDSGTGIANCGSSRRKCL